MRKLKERKTLSAAEVLEVTELHREILRLAKKFGPEVQSAGKSFGALARAWLESEATRYVEPENERRHVAHLQKLWDNNESTLTPKVVRACLLELLRPKGRLGPNSVNKVQSAGGKIIRWAQIEGEWGGTNPFELLPRLKETKPIYEKVTLKECRTFLPYLRPDRRRMALTMLYLGLRPGELIAIQKVDVDMRRGLLTVKRSRSRNATKTGAVRQVPIPDRLVPVLKEAMAESPSEFVFPGADGGKMRDDTKLARCLQEAFRKAGLVTAYGYFCNKKDCRYRDERPEKEPARCPKCDRRLLIVGMPRKVRFYDLRHSCATLHREAGCDPRVIQIVLGHAPNNLTDEIYTHVSDDYIRLEINRLTLDQ
jgi:integrase